MPNLLIVDPLAFRYGWTGSTQRIMDLAYGLAGHGWQSTLLSSAIACDEPAGGPDAQFPGRVVRTTFHGYPWPSFIPNRRGLRTVWTRLGLTRLLFADPERTGWASLLRRRITATKLLVPKPDVVWGIAYSDLRGLVAARDLAENLEIPLVLEIQDPIPNPNTRLSHFEDVSFRTCLSAAALVVTTTKSFARWLQERYSEPAGKVCVEYLSYDDSVPMAEADASEASGGLLLLHAGTLQGGAGRNAVPLVEAMALARRRQPEAILKLQLMGNGAGVQEALGLAQRLGLQDAVSFVPPMDHAGALQRMRRADVLVVIKFADSAYDMQIPGKLFQYLPFGKPIVGIMARCEAASILQDTGLGIVLDPRDLGGICDCLLALWRDRNRLGCLYRRKGAYTQEFSRSSMATRVDAHLRAVLVRGVGAGEVHAFKSAI